MWLEEEKCAECLATTICKHICNSTRCILCNKTDHTSSETQKFYKWKYEQNLRAIMTLTNSNVEKMY